MICHSDAGCQIHAQRLHRPPRRLAAAPIGTVGHSLGTAIADSAIGLFKTELHRNPAALRANSGHWRGLDDLEIAPCGGVGWFNEERFHRELDDVTIAEVEDAYDRHSQSDAA